MRIFKKFMFAVLGVILAISTVNAQDYKHPEGLIKEDGKVFNNEGKHIGWITKDGIVKDTSGQKVAEIDSEGNLVESATGKKLGKAEKNGNFTPYFSKTPDDKWSVSAPVNGNCTVKDKNGKTVVIIHENYKQQGACAYHCLTVKKNDTKTK
ncbi:MAG TPA: hypothetical protein VNB90_11905 [Cytophagaceae bacterium]|nr:hypothetical protein [Cytophagaceae bacterium]